MTVPVINLIFPTLLSAIKTVIGFLGSFESGKSNLPNRDYVIFEWDFRDLYLTDSNKLTLAPEECNLSVIRTDEWKYVHFPHWIIKGNPWES